MFPVSVDQSTSQTSEQVLINVSLLYSPKKQTSKFPFILLERCEVVFHELAKLKFQLPFVGASLVYKFCSHESIILHDRVINPVASRAGSQTENMTSTADYAKLLNYDYSRILCGSPASFGRAFF